MQINTRTRSHHTAVRMAKTQILTTARAGEDVEKLELSYTAGGKGKWESLWKTVWQFQIK